MTSIRPHQHARSAIGLLAFALSLNTGCIAEVTEDDLSNVAQESDLVPGINALDPAQACAARAGMAKPWERSSTAGVSFNPCNGNFSHIVAIGETGLMLHHNSRDASANEGFGYGFRLNIRETATVDSAGHVTIVRGDGESVTFVKSGTAYITPVGLTSRLSLTGNSYVETLQGGLKRRFDYVAGKYRLAVITDRNGNVTTLVRNSLGQETQIIDPVGRRTYLSWVSNRLTTIRDLDGLIHTLTYDGQGQLSSSVAPAVNGVSPTTYFAYDTGGYHLITQRSAPSGGISAYRYYADGSLESFTTSGGETTTVEYSSTTTKVNLFVGTSMTTTYANGAVVADVADDGSTTTFARDSLKRITQLTNPMGETTSFTYNSTHDVATMTDALGKIYYSSWDDRHNLVSFTDADNLTYTQTFDAFDGLLTFTDPNGETSTLVRDSRGNVTSVIDAAGDTAYSASYDNRGKLLSETNVYGVTATYSYNGLSQLTSATTPSLGSMSASWTTAGRPIQLVRGGLTQSISYDSSGRVVTRQVSRGTASQAVTLGYQGGNRLPSSVSRVVNGSTWSNAAISRDGAGRATATTINGRSAGTRSFPAMAGSPAPTTSGGSGSGSGSGSN